MTEKHLRASMTSFASLFEFLNESKKTIKPEDKQGATVLISVQSILSNRSLLFDIEEQNSYQLEYFPVILTIIIIIRL